MSAAVRGGTRRVRPPLDPLVRWCLCVGICCSSEDIWHHPSTAVTSSNHNWPFINLPSSQLRVNFRLSVIHSVSNTNIVVKWSSRCQVVKLLAFKPLWDKMAIKQKPLSKVTLIPSGVNPTLHVTLLSFWIH